MQLSNRQFSGTWAVILGGSSGFGLASVKKLAMHGMSIAVLYRETAIADRSLKTQLTQIAGDAGIEILPFNINALDVDAQTRFTQQFKEKVNGAKCVKLLLHSIARGNLKPLVSGDHTINKSISELSQDDIRFTGYAMATSILDWTRLILDAALFAEDARVIGLTSEGAHKYWESYAAVSIAKSSLESLAKYMAVEMAGHGLRTNLIQAGITNTPSLKRIPGSEELIDIANRRNPLGRITTPADVADVVYLLCTPEAAWINGALIHVDGGEHCK